MQKPKSRSKSEVGFPSIETILKVLEQKANKPLKIAKAIMLNENIHHKEVREAIQYYLDHFLNSTPSALLTLSSETVNENTGNLSEIGAAISLIFGAIDIHDDIIDKSLQKNNQKTVYGKFGVEIALLVGDALLLEGFAILNKTITPLGIERTNRVTEAIKRAFIEMGEAHALEVSLKGDLDITPERYHRIVRMKAASWEAVTKIGAILGDGTEEEVEALATYGRIWGILSTIRNDFIDLYECDELNNRLKNEIPPLPILIAFQDPKIRNKIAILLSGNGINEESLEIILDLILESKLMNKLKRFLRIRMDEAEKSLSLLTRSNARSLLVDMTYAMLQDIE